MNAKAKGYVLGAIAAATYGMNPLFALPLYKAGMNPDSVLYLQPIITQYFIDNKSEIWLLFLIAHSKR